MEVTRERIGAIVQPGMLKRLVSLMTVAVVVSMVVSAAVSLGLRPFGIGGEIEVWVRHTCFGLACVIVGGRWAKRLRNGDQR